MPEPAPRGEVAAMVALQSALAGRPGVLAVARGMSHFGEHSVGWLIVELLGALLWERRRRNGWSPRPARSPRMRPPC